MSFATKIKTVSEIINGTYSEYDADTGVIIVPVDEHRFQTVYGYSQENGMVKFVTKVCDIDEMEDNIPYRALVHHAGELDYAAFYVENGSLYARATVTSDASVSALQMVIEEVALNADKWEFKITGKDIN